MGNDEISNAISFQFQNSNNQLNLIQRNGRQFFMLLFFLVLGDVGAGVYLQAYRS